MRATDMHDAGTMLSRMFLWADGAVPLSAPHGVAVFLLLAAVHVHGPAYRFPDPDHSHDTGMLVVEAATRLAEQLAD